MTTKYFVYTWEIDPISSHLIGPFDTRDAAVDWIDDLGGDYENTGLLQFPFETITSISKGA